MLKILLFSHFLSRSCSLSPSHSFRSFSFKQPWTAAECIFLIDFFPHSYCSPRFMYMFVAFSAHSNQGFSFYFFFFGDNFARFGYRSLLIIANIALFHCQMTSYHQHLSFFRYILSEFYGCFITIHLDISLGNVRSIFHGHKLIDFITFWEIFQRSMQLASYQWRKRL